jgi:hypothetical protein
MVEVAVAVGAVLQFPPLEELKRGLAVESALLPPLLSFSFPLEPDNNAFC